MSAFSAKHWLTAALLVAATGTALALPSYEETRAAYRPASAQLLARDGRPLQSLRLDSSVWRQAWTPLSEVSPALIRAVVLSEDKRFYEHEGVDWQAAGKAAWGNFWNSRTRGASTLSMQLAGLLEEDGRRRGRRSLLEKVSQTALALRLEQAWSKKQILEAYLNLASFRGELQGVAAMSRGVFGKWPVGLDERESALAAALLRSPNAAQGTVAARACRLLQEAARGQECSGLESLAALALTGAYKLGDGGPNAAPHLARKLLTAPGQRLRSTLDADLQGFAYAALRRHLAALAKQNAEDGAVVVVDNGSGEVLAWVGSSGDLSGAAEVDGAVALRQAGSTLKPFLYALAFERRQLTPATLIEDAPLNLDTGNGLYAPQNYEPQYRGWVSARMALGGSLNVPAVKTLVALGADAFHQRLKQSGFASLKQTGDWYGYSLALGSADVSLLMLANGYRTLANGGRWLPLRVTFPSSNADASVPCRQEGCAGVFAERERAAFTAPSAFLVADILADRSARASTFGLESWLATPYWAAAKTGTSKDMRDNWCVGFSRRYTVAVWVGNASGEPMHDVSGVSGAAPVWREVMDWLHRGDSRIARPRQESRPPSVPAGVVRTSLRFQPPLEPPRREVFIAGTEMSLVRGVVGESLARIAYPTDGTIIALDPDIPPERQRISLRLSASAPSKGLWRLDGQRLGRASSQALWLPRPGRHRLVLEDGAGKELDAVSFDVRALRSRR